MLNNFGLVLTEKQIIRSTTVDDIDFGAVRAFMRAQGLDPDEASQPAREDDLKNGSIVDELDGVPRPTLYGLMVFGRALQGFERGGVVPDTAAECLRKVRLGEGSARKVEGKGLIDTEGIRCNGSRARRRKDRT